MVFIHNMLRKLLLLFLLIFSFHTLSAQQRPSDKVYIDKVYPFSVAYPKDWVSVAPTQPQTRFKAFSDSGLGFADFNIGVATVKGAENITPQQFVDFIKNNPSLIEQLVKSEIPNAEIVEKGETYLSNRKAYYVKSTEKIKLVDDEVDLKIWTILMVFKGRRYSFTCRSSPLLFDEYVPTFKRLINTFTILPK